MIEILKKEGAKYILDSSDEKFTLELKDLCTKLNATIYFDPVAGELTASVLNCMPKGSTAYVYGMLSMKPC